MDDPSDSRDDEAAFIADYRKPHFAKPSVTVDLAVFTLEGPDLRVLLIRRGRPPFQGRWAFPGGFVEVGDAFDDQGEDLDDAAHRELEEETSLPRGTCRIEQLHVFGKPYRDERTRIITVAYLALLKATWAGRITAGDDASDARWWSVREVLARGSDLLAFDHAAMLDVALARLRLRIATTSLASEVLPPTFTRAELRAVFEAVAGPSAPPARIERDIRRLLADGVLERLPRPAGSPGRSPARFGFAGSGA